MYNIYAQCKIFVLNTLYLHKRITMAINKTINPFVNALHVPYIEYIKKVTGGPDNPVFESFQVEAEPFTRVYNTKARREFVYTRLSVWGRDMLLAIQYMGIKDERYLIISHEKLSLLYGNKMYNKRRYDSTIRELISFNMIDHKDKDKNQFWYNPEFLCFSNRITAYPECALKMNTVRL